ncbi:hypothetical protein PP175_21590 [Aneurinibacillus sp. Ricciae_BoGa-3]|uniref:hypothetical protein n=1 Tax=Aneurinibacillus sp. Ricciae_BoGa-3 TaxID=3022697 RepID=UPI00233F86D5|nr:hypothetical protein [Aneurinibacillus sp. Ricciae_BoGa-3]WCK53885.1 hypothetical protein PP175_21590 [Aneurinibacillus sp. Ricciae_BoGa-3]
MAWQLSDTTKPVKFQERNKIYAPVNETKPFGKVETFKKKDDEVTQTVNILEAATDQQFTVRAGGENKTVKFPSITLNPDEKVTWILKIEKDVVIEPEINLMQIKHNPHSSHSIIKPSILDRGREEDKAGMKIPLNYINLTLNVATILFLSSATIFLILCMFGVALARTDSFFAFILCSITGFLFSVDKLYRRFIN